MRLDGNIALVTGAASGIGKACADRLEGAGARVVRADIDDTDARIRRLDVTDVQAWQELLGRLAGSGDHPDILINAAGISLAGDTLGECTPEIWRRTMTVNLFGPVIGMNQVLPIMRRRGSGSIINIASVLAHRGSGDAAAYAASKGALLMATKCAALLCAKEAPGVRANSISPGYVETPLLSNWADSITDGAQALHEIAAKIPMGRMGTADDVAGLAIFLASDKAAAITGADFIVDGGLRGCQSR